MNKQVKRRELPYAGVQAWRLQGEGNRDENAFPMTAAEAKTAALQELNVRAERAGGRDGGEKAYATGTTGDALLFMAIGEGPHYRYAGTAAVIGYLLGRTEFEAAAAAGRRYLAYA